MASKGKISDERDLRTVFELKRAYISEIQSRCTSNLTKKQRYATGSKLKNIVETLDCLVEVRRVS